MRLAAISQGTSEMMAGAIRQADAAVEEIDAYVGAKVRARRIEIGLSQAALGRHLGVTFSQVQKYEKGSNRIGAGRLFHLAMLLGVPVQYFFEGLDGPAGGGDTHAAISAAELARLQAAFQRIADPLTRQALVSLASSMGEGA